MTELKGATALVTGSSRGIGRAIAAALIDAGVKVAITARTGVDVNRARTELAARAAADDVSAVGIVGDVRRHADCKRMVEETVAAFGGLDILINNAGIGAFETVADMTPEIWDSVIQTNLNGVFYCTHEALPHLKKSGNGWIINIGSLAGKNAFPRGGAYNASKFGLIGFSEALMQEVRYDDIRVSYIMPGSVATEFMGRTSDEGSDWRIAPEDVARAVTDVLSYPGRSLTSRIELRPSRPPRRN